MTTAGHPTMQTITLYRAADSDTLTDCGSFAESLETASAYLANPGYGGATLWETTVDVDEDTLLDLSEMGEEEAIEALCERTGLDHPGAIGADEWVPRISYDLRDSGICWVRVRESYPEDTVTWIWVGGDDPEMVEAEG